MLKGIPFLQNNILLIIFKSNQLKKIGIIWVLKIKHNQQQFIPIHMHIQFM
jgi:hypothetical protein